MSDPTSPVLFLDDFIALDTIEYNLLRNGEPTGWIWTLTDVGHPQTVKLREEQERRALKKQQAREAAMLNNRKVKPDEVSPQEQRQELVEAIAGRVLHFSPINVERALPEFPGVTEYSPQAVIKILSHPKLTWVLNDLTNAVTDARTFMKASESN